MRLYASRHNSLRIRHFVCVCFVGESIGNLGAKIVELRNVTNIAINVIQCDKSLKKWWVENHEENHMF